ncbi:MAG: 4-(cytidine 5'-diphospho)-2-C-methyl-D-erythritol kinase [Chitinophagaceae bacterium]
MVAFPNCKINLGLNIIRKREDGYHDIETVFYPLPLCDAVEVIVLPEIRNQQSDVRNQKSEIQNLSTSGLNIEGKIEENLCIKAVQLLKKNFSQLPPIQMHLHKAIPVGAGLGGGSADAIFILQLLNEKFELKLSKEQLFNYAKELGSDCPFFIINKPCFATGRGEILQEIHLDLSKYYFVIVNAAIHINTKWAFAQIQSQQSFQRIIEIINEPIVKWKNYLANDFEQIIAKKYPEIIAIKNKLYDAGAIYSSMSGSGSSVYGIFENEIPEINFPAEYFYVHLKNISASATDKTNIINHKNFN